VGEAIQPEFAVFNISLTADRTRPSLRCPPIRTQISSFCL
jgi:hypothetical protein